MKIVVTGATSFVGLGAVRELHGDGFLYDECLLSDRADLKDAMDACGGADCNVRGACGEYLM